jgi:hypothetical protein
MVMCGRRKMPFFCLKLVDWAYCLECKDDYQKKNGNKSALVQYSFGMKERQE